MLQPDKIYEQLVQLGTAWADAQYEAELLEETRKTLIAQLATESKETSVSAREAFAFRHASYDSHIKSMVGARKKANTAKVRYDSARIWSELKRTESANERAANRSAT